MTDREWSRGVQSAWSPGWRANVELGPGQMHTLALLRAVPRPHPSRMWQTAPRMRDFDRSPGTAHRHLRRLAALGVIAVQSTLGRAGVVRFTFGVTFWRRSPIRRANVARMAPGQITLTVAPPVLPVRAAPTDPGGLCSSPAGPSGSFAEQMTLAGFARWWRP